MGGNATTKLLKVVKKELGRLLEVYLDFIKDPDLSSFDLTMKEAELYKEWTRFLDKQVSKKTDRYLTYLPLFLESLNQIKSGKLKPKE